MTALARHGLLGLGVLTSIAAWGEGRTVYRDRAATGGPTATGESGAEPAARTAGR